MGSIRCGTASPTRTCCSTPISNGYLPAELVDLLVPEGPEDALVPLGRAWMQAKQARKELAAAAGTPDAWHMVGGLRRTDPVSPDVAMLAVTGGARRVEPEGGRCAAA